MASLKNTYDQQGFVIIPSLIPAVRFNDLKRATERVIGLTRRGQWPYRRTVGRQFPPFDSDDTDSWGIQHVMHPDLHEPEFARWYTSDALVHVITELLECDERELQMGQCSFQLRLALFNNKLALSLELFNILINPTMHEFALRWHRDDIREDVSEEEEISALNVSYYGVSTL